MNLASGMLGLLVFFISYLQTIELAALLAQEVFKLVRPCLILDVSIHLLTLVYPKSFLVLKKSYSLLLVGITAVAY